MANDFCTDEKKKSLQERQNLGKKHQKVQTRKAAQALAWEDASKKQIQGQEQTFPRAPGLLRTWAMEAERKVVVHQRVPLASAPGGLEPRSWLDTWS